MAYSYFDSLLMESLCNVLFSFSDTCQMTVKSFVLYLFPVPKTGSDKINMVLASFYNPRAWPLIDENGLAGQF